MNPIALELNDIIKSENPKLLDSLSETGKKLFFPKGILSQSAEAKEKASKFNATIGIAKERKRTMFLGAVADIVGPIAPEDYLNYSPSFGNSLLRDVWKEEIFKKNPSIKGKNISLPVVTCGITNAIRIVSDMWLDKDDPVIMPDMTWGNYLMMFQTIKGARPSFYSFFTDDMQFNIPTFETAVKSEAAKHKKIGVLLNFPHNPSGYTLTKKEGGQIVKILTDTARKGTNVIAFIDDAYFGLFYSDESMKESLFASLCDADPGICAIKLDGATKEMFSWGLRIGFITYGAAPYSDFVYNALEKKTAGCVRGNISNASNLGQTVVLRALQNKGLVSQKNDKFEIFKKRYKKVKDTLTDPKYQDVWDVYPFNSGYFMCLSLKTVDAHKLRVHLLDKYQTGVIAIDDKILRIAFSSLEEGDIKEMFDIIFMGVKDLEAL